MQNQKKKVILSGIQPSGVIHLGNYFGAMKQYVDLQDTSINYFFIANFHALTTLRNPQELQFNTLDIARHYLAIGLDPDKCALFLQSDVPEVCELSWYLSIITPLGLLERCHSYKDKLAKGFSPEHGLFAYPILMAADILMYEPDFVPVGKDQKQHVEVARDIAIKFNNTFGNIMKIPEVMIKESTAVVPGIDGQKMSKSYGNFISFLSDEKTIKKQVMSIVTNSTAVEEPKDPAQCNVFALYKLFAQPDEIISLQDRYVKGGLGYGEAKKILLAKLLDYFAESRVRYNQLKADDQYVKDVLKKGADKAREQADSFMIKVRNAVGIVRSN
ncbi:MAG: tryptophan--tRNA ligase [Spirochaetes bacterium GWF1_31_7]|nr:MAG: tryptophan--tRNA ligase [Spirochaetes bacterium GWE1_32_154]OHD47615.1 MAG: tryptophan--tRNA ligase [Spirochaetes bacterium GWE2_31_10]OHD49279.1 MAG: tryptophan--tRNA ligase [Spirochaetes bacterium GWF1_31_7]HBD95018.1 tryptophan--tRNA ligase [Spirochaetia bacterium]HBI37367.1 tryptophan--tRNA ligase [Spirochaetia bacterium]